MEEGVRNKMRDHWIDAGDYTMECCLLFDRWVLRWIFTECSYYEGDYVTDMAKALYRYPYIDAFCRAKAPECGRFLDKVRAVPCGGWTDDEMREAETAILQAQETFVVYAYPKVMNQVNYIRYWDAKYLHRLVDLTDKVILDVGSGTGRLAFAAAKKAKRVYASEPCDRLREYMRDKIKAESITNMKVADGSSSATGMTNGSAAPRTKNWYPAALNGFATKARSAGLFMITGSRSKNKIQDHKVQDRKVQNDEVQNLIIQNHRMQNLKVQIIL